MADADNTASRAEWYLTACEMLGTAFGVREVSARARDAFDAALRHADAEIEPSESQEVSSAIDRAKLVARGEGLRSALEDFLSSEDYGRALEISTRSAWGGQGCAVVELDDDGTYRLLHSAQVGNLYDSKGIMLSIPSMGELGEGEIEDAVAFELEEGVMARALGDELAERLGK